MNKTKAKTILGISLASIALVCFLVIMIMAMLGHSFAIDQFNIVVANNRNNVLTGFLKIFTHLGSFYVLAVLALIAVAIIWFVFKNKRLAIFSAGYFAIVCVANFVIKNIVQRLRPQHLMIIEETGYSFPSGHAMMTLGLMGLFIYFAYKFLKNKPLKILTILMLTIITIAIGFSRIYLGVHYLTDILAGWLITLVLLVAFILLYNSNLFRPKPIQEQKNTENN